MKLSRLLVAVLSGLSLVLLGLSLHADDSHKHKEKDKKQKDYNKYTDEYLAAKAQKKEEKKAYEEEKKRNKYRGEYSSRHDRDRGSLSGFLWSKLDVDGDGKLSAEEIAQAPAVLSALDRDQDGSVSAAEAGFTARGSGEVVPPAAAGARDSKPSRIQSNEMGRSDDDDDDDDDDDGHGAKVGSAERGGAGLSSEARAWMAYDKNGDGKLSAEELPKRLAAALMKADANGDGFVDSTELEAHLQNKAPAPAAAVDAAPAPATTEAPAPAPEAAPAPAGE